MIGLLLAGVWSALSLWSNLSFQVPVAGFLGLLSLAWLLVIFAWKTLKLSENRSTIWLILGFAALHRLPSFFALPLYEDDYFRFMWDGWNFLQAGTPYLGPPADFFDDPKVPEAFQNILLNVNYPEVPTIYPPICELFFAGAALIAPGKILGLRLVFFAVEFLVLFLFSRIANVRQLLLLAWCPLMVFETTFQIHPDVLGMAFLFLAYFYVRKEQPIATGLFCGLALGIKVTALPALPFLLWPLRGKSLVTLVLTIIMMYLPFFLQGSRADFDGLAVFSREWEFNAAVYALAASQIPATAAKLLMTSIYVLIFFFIWFHWVRRKSPVEKIPQLLVVVYGLFFFISPVINSWYLIWIVPFVALAPQAWSLTALGIVSVSYIRGQTLPVSWNLADFDQPVWIQTAEFSIVLILATLALVRGHKKARVTTRAG